VARVDFYHLTRDAAPAVVAKLAERVLAGGDRLGIIAADTALRDAIDAALWTENAESFLPHAPPDQPAAASGEEPIVFLDGLANPPANGAQMLILADGRWQDAALMAARAFFLFDNAQIDDARAAWRMLGQREGTERHYWKQDDGGRWREGP